MQSFDGLGGTTAKQSTHEPEIPSLISDVNNVGTHHAVNFSSIFTELTLITFLYKSLMLCVINAISFLIAKIHIENCCRAFIWQRKIFIG